MKKLIITFLIAICLFSILLLHKTYATEGNAILQSNTAGQLIEIKEKSLNELKDYQEAYGEDTYGLVAFILNKVRFYSIPICFLGIAFSAIYQYVIGIRKLDTRYKGFFALIAFITILVICQVLPLIFVVVVKFGRS